MAAIRLLLALPVPFAVACEGGGGGMELGDGGADADTDADTDTDADADTDTDTDADTDSDADADTDTDADADTDSDADADEDQPVCIDDDSDGWCLPFDCDDEDPFVNPGMQEIPDNDIDDNCNGLTDEQPLLEDWDIHITVDNQFDIYFGSPTATTGAVVGGGTHWPTEYHYTAVGRLPTDYLYVATASDQYVAQGFIGTFTNVTLGKTTNTGDDVWEVFPAGAYQETNPHWPDPWPVSQMPTQAQVDAAILFAETNGLWVTPVGAPGYDNDPDTTPDPPYTFPWGGGNYPNIPAEAAWIWHQSATVYSGLRPSPLEGFNHDEFLVFRVAGAIPWID